ncbi:MULTISPECIES: hypothetical protein [unclassified Streptomyces]|uniref:hypothetical protein n=1 Tax=unclassified Streptomyces TaxID=2593676 RepID=UPI0037F41C22
MPGPLSVSRCRRLGWGFVDKVRRVVASHAECIRYLSDPGTEALAAQYELEQAFATLPAAAGAHAHSAFLCDHATATDTVGAMGDLVEHLAFGLLYDPDAKPEDRPNTARSSSANSNGSNFGPRRGTDTPPEILIKNLSAWRAA